MSLSPPVSPRRGAISPFSVGARGFTLVEVIMSVFVLALVVTTAITTLQAAFMNLDSARNIETASRIMQCELEKERLLDWAQVSSAAYQPAIDASFLRNPEVAGRFSLARAVAVVPNRAGKIVQVTLTTTWRTFDGRSQQRSTTTYFGENGLHDYFTTQG